MRAALARVRPHLVAAAGFSAAVNLLYIAPTLYMLQVYDRVVPTGGGRTLAFLTLVLLFALGTLALLDRVRARLLVRAGVALDAAVAPALLDATLGRPDRAEAHGALRDLDNLRATLSGPGALALFDAPWVPIYLLACTLVHPLIGLVALVGGVALPLLAWANERATRPALDDASRRAAAAYAGQDAVLASAEAVRALGMRRALVARGQRERRGMLALQTGAGFRAGSYFTATKFVRLALQSLALGLGAWLAIDNRISGGAIFASSFLIARALAPIEQAIGSWRAILGARRGWHAIDRLLEDERAAPAPTALPAPRGALRLEGVTVLTPERDAALLNAVSFGVEPGEVVAIVGPSGAGKSTLLRTVAGALAPDAGTVRLDEADAAHWNRERLARHLGYLPQDTALVAGTVKENICRFATELGADPAETDVAAVAAARTVGAEGLVLRLSGGFDHPLGLGGRGLSAGQAQRVALARAVYGDPALLLLDEPNAHLDAEGDAALNAALAALKGEGRTVLVVSHKLSILPVVDRILVLQAGKVELYGPRDEVLAKIAPANVRRITPQPPAPAPSQASVS